MRRDFNTLTLIANGSGEDRIGAEFARVWRELNPEIQIQALPLVGSGLFYQQAGISLLKDGFTPPSQGFAYLKPSLLLKDLQAGVLPHLQQSFKAIRYCDSEFVIAIGDIVPMLAAFYARKPFAFVGCALSDYYLGENSRRSTYDPLQRWILKRTHALCFARDALTAANLTRKGIRAHFLGNPMLDCFDRPKELGGAGTEPIPGGRHRVLILPGSHADAAPNFEYILSQLQGCLELPIDWLLLKAPQLEQNLLEKSLIHWQAGPKYWLKQSNRLAFVDSSNFQSLLQKVDCVLGFAGTANEQAVGMGVPVVSFALPGAQQYTWAFGEAQQRLLGAGLSYLGEAHPQLVAYQIQRILRNPEYRQAAQTISQQRFGTKGGVDRMILMIESDQSLVSR